MLTVSHKKVFGVANMPALRDIFCHCGINAIQKSVMSGNIAGGKAGYGAAVFYLVCPADAVEDDFVLYAVPGAEVHELVPGFPPQGKSFFIAHVNQALVGLIHRSGFQQICADGNSPSFAIHLERKSFVNKINEQDVKFLSLKLLQQPLLKIGDNGLPLVAPADERWLVDFTVIFSSDADWAPVRMKLPVPKAESKQKLNKFCKAAAGNYGMDVIRFAQALAEMPMEEVVQMFNSNRAIFESNDEIDFQAQKFGGVVLTALTIAEQMTGLTFHKKDVIAFLNEALAEPQDDTEED